ncbi:YdaU family protein [Acinetobacter soli]|uniref:YdaU family protein n=1 Tax=Acinetobacter soli TaxID=487316 RepID=A0AB38YW88_9GAMM|nr:YdaU family protein [Acinetobacter soli]WND04471.1 YdaU family protein [Acinetobacter soli]WND05607.1 YdaU family protein [Acinetobacter soli]
MYKYLHHIGDFMVDTAHLTPLEECFYRRAIDLYYLNEKPLPKETQSVFRRLRAITQEEREAVINVLQDFFVEQEDGFHNKRCDAEIAEYQLNANKNRENGKKGGRPPKKKPEDNPNTSEMVINENPKETQSVILGSQSETQKNLNRKPLTDNHINNTHTLGADENQNESWKPDSNILINVIRESVGIQAQSVLDMPDYEFHLGNFNAYREDKIGLTENQRTRKFAQWLIQEFKKAKSSGQPKNQSKSNPTVSRNVNDAHGDIPDYAPAVDNVNTEGLV